MKNSEPISPEAIDHIARVAQQFRTAIERCDKTLLPERCAKFPRGACEDTALMLARFLKEHNCGEFIDVRGTRWVRSPGVSKWLSPETHVWLECGRVIVDITGDQFAECSSAVIVTTRSPLHAKFKERKNGTPREMPSELRAAYAEVMRHISQDASR